MYLVIRSLKVNCLGACLQLNLSLWTVFGHITLLLVFSLSDDRASPHFSSVGHKQCAMLFRRYVSRTAAGSGRAVLEGVGLSHEAIQMCYSKSFQNEE